MCCVVLWKAVVTFMWHRGYSKNREATVASVLWEPVLACWVALFRSQCLLFQCRSVTYYI